ncbi:hypothetical protein Tco_1267795 [Tanacetum coccineum]
MEKLSFDLNVRKESSGSNEAAQYGKNIVGNPMLVSFEIHHGGCFTSTPSRSYVDGHVSSVNVVDIDEFCLHDLKEMIVKLGYGVVDLIVGKVCYNKIILVYVEHGSTNVDSSIFVKPKKGVAIAVDNHLRKAPIEIDSSPEVNRNLTPMCHSNKQLAYYDK